MSASKPGQREKPREWRRRVLVPARMLSASGWSDARILNISSRGLMVHAPKPIDPGSMIELRRGDQRIVARVMWREGLRAGLQSETVLPLTDILCLSEAPAAEVVDARAVPSDRRARRNDDVHRLRGRLIEFVSVTGIASVIAIAVTSIVARFAGAQYDIVSAALAG